MFAQHEPAYFGATEESRFDVARCNLVWDRYDAVLFPDGYGGREPGPTAASFYNQRFAIGLLSDMHREKLIACLEGAASASMHCGANHPDFLESPHDAATINRVNSDHHFYRFDGKQLWAVWDVLEEMYDTISAVFGAPWRVLMVKGWRTDRNTDFGMNAWHTDGLANSAMKLMLYLTPIGDGGGGLEFRPNETDAVGLSAPAGAWVLFQNSHILHRGVAPTVPGKYRSLIEITLGPALEPRIKPLYAGVNARNPLHPWMDVEFFPLDYEHA